MSLGSKPKVMLSSTQFSFLACRQRTSHNSSFSAQWPNWLSRFTRNIKNSSKGVKLRTSGLRDTMATTGPPRPPIMSPTNWDSLGKKMLLGCPHEWLPLLLLFGFSEPGFPQTLINFKLSSKKPVKIRKKGKGKKKIWKTLDEKKNSGAEKSKISKIARNVKFFSKKEKKFLSSILTTSFFRVSHSKRELNLGIARSLASFAIRGTCLLGFDAV